MRISDAQLDQVRQQGYVLIDGFLTEAEVSAARANLLRYVPTADELAATPERYPWVFEEAERLQTEFPFSGHALNHVSTHPDLIDAVERLLGTKQVLLTQSAAWAKFAGTGDFEQALHLDYEGNTLVVPRDDGDYRQVNAILYYTDVPRDLGPTCVVPMPMTRKLPLWPTFRPRKKHPELYRLEKSLVTRAGGLLIFGMQTWHRASEITAEAGVRLSHHMIWRSAAHVFQGYHQWSNLGEKPEFKRFIEFSTPRQREVLGFPPANHPYWNEQTIAAVQLRYPKMDMTPYATALARTSTKSERKR